MANSTRTQSHASLNQPWSIDEAFIAASRYDVPFGNGGACFIIGGTLGRG
jgi:hypothetical protein